MKATNLKDQVLEYAKPTRNGVAGTLFVKVKYFDILSLRYRCTECARCSWPFYVGCVIVWKTKNVFQTFNLVS